MYYNGPILVLQTAVLQTLNSPHVLDHPFSVQATHSKCCLSKMKTRMWANAQPDGRPAKHRWRPLFNAVKFG